MEKQMKGEKTATYLKLYHNFNMVNFTSENLFKFKYL